MAGITQRDEAPKFVSFLSDFGARDEFVGVCKAVILELAPEVVVIDVTHGVRPFDVRGGGLSLVRAIQYLPSGIVLAIVDPGVGTERRSVAVEVENGVLIGPDNGLLAPSVAMLGGAQRVFSLTNPDYQLKTHGATFAGRDVMAPAAGHLMAGIAIEKLGEQVDPSGLVPGLVALPQEGPGGVLVGEVLWVDRFGNAQLNIDPEMLEAHGVLLGDQIEVQVGGAIRIARWVTTYAEARPAELCILTDSSGLLSLVLDKESAAAHLGADAGIPVVIVPMTAAGALSVTEMPIALRPTTTKVDPK